MLRKQETNMLLFFRPARPINLGQICGHGSSPVFVHVVCGAAGADSRSEGGMPLSLTSQRMCVVGAVLPFSAVWYSTR